MTVHKEVIFANGWPKIVRFSKCIAKLREAVFGDVDRFDVAESTIKLLTDLYEKHGNTCSVHGHLNDPIIFNADVEGEDQIVFACPLCSDQRLREQWEAEGPL